MFFTNYSILWMSKTLLHKKTALAILTRVKEYLTTDNTITNIKW